MYSLFNKAGEEVFKNFISLDAAENFLINHKEFINVSLRIQFVLPKYERRILITAPNVFKTYKIRNKDIIAITKLLNEHGYKNKNKRKEVAERVLMDDEKGINYGVTDTFNYSLFGEGTETDLSSLYELSTLKNVEVEINKEGYIDLDIWIYERGEFGELEQTIAVYLIVLNNKIEITLDRPTQADILRHAVAVKSGRV